MRPAPLIASGGLLLLACSCYGPSFQQPYGGYPGYPGQVQPGTPYYPGGTGVPGGPTLGPATPTFESGQAPNSEGAENAPYFGSSSSSGGERRVPDYPTDSAASDSTYFPPVGSGAPSGSATIPEVAPLGFQLDEPATPLPAVTPTPQPASSESNPFFPASPDGDDFRPPVQNNPISFQREVSAVTNQPYGQGQGHRWLQGVVNRDPRDGTWGIIYDIEPDASDPYAGYLTIAQHSQVQGLQDGDVVRLEGRVDPVEKDRFGRATYLISRVAAATPSGG